MSVIEVGTTSKSSNRKRIDLLPLFENLYIVDKDGREIRLGDVMHEPQRAIVEEFNRCLNNDLPIRIVVLKARQIGISTAVEGILFLFAMCFNRMKGLVISHELDSSEHLLQMTQNYFDNFDFKDAYVQKNKSAKTLSWLGIQSDIRITTAGNKQAGRSRTIRFLHASEVGFWDNAKILMTGLAQVVPQRPKTVIVLESTANGIGNYFHETWTAACDGRNDYVPMFFPWWTHIEYKASFIGKSPLKLSDPLDEYERALVKLMTNPPQEKWNGYHQDPIDINEILDRLAWRRSCIANECQGDLLKFQQEYPSTPEEAFIATGKNVFSLDSLTRCFDYSQGVRGRIERNHTVRLNSPTVRFQPDPIEGQLIVFKAPGKGEDYVVAGDPTRSMDGDYAVAQVINRRTWEQVAIYREKVDGRTFGERCGEIGMYYNEAIIAIEQLGGGEAAIAVLQDRDYPNIWQHVKADRMPGQIDNFYGWQTNSKTKPEAISNLRKVLEDGDSTFHDQVTYSQLRNYISLGGGKFGNSNEEEHDDNVMSYAIGITVIMYEAAELLFTQVDRRDEYIPKPGMAPKLIRARQQVDNYMGPAEPTPYETPWFLDNSNPIESIEEVFDAS